MLHKIITMILATTLMTAGLGLGLDLVGAQASTMKIYPTDDVFVVAGSRANENFNRNTNLERLRIGNSGAWDKMRSYLKFDLSNLSDKTINTVSFSIEAQGGPLGNPRLELYYVENDAWIEDSLTWNSATSSFSYSGFVLDSVIIDDGDRINLDVTSVVANETDNEISFVIKAQQESQEGVYADFSSKEYLQGETWWPYLEVNYGSQSYNSNIDLNGDGCISDEEFPTAVSNWIHQNGVSDEEFPTAVSNWIHQINC
jgi:hypothetical protein